MAVLVRMAKPHLFSGSPNWHLYRRLPKRVLDALGGRRPRLVFHMPGVERPIGATPSRVGHLKLSLRTRDEAEAKHRFAVTNAQFEEQCKIIEEGAPLDLTWPEAVALSGKLYGHFQQVFEPDPFNFPLGSLGPVRERLEAIEEASKANPELDAGWKAMLDEFIDAYLAENLPHQSVTPASRDLLRRAFASAIRKSLERLEKVEEGEFPEPKAFPEWQHPRHKPRPGQPKVPLDKIVNQWLNGKAKVLKPRTLVDYRNRLDQFIDWLKGNTPAPNDAAEVSPEAIRAYRDFRLETNKPKTVKDSDLACLKSLFKWAVDNGHLPTNPAKDVRVEVAKEPSLRSRHLSPTETANVLREVLAYQPSNREPPKLAAAKRWCPLLMAYSGARVGEVLQLRARDISEETIINYGEASDRGRRIWVMRITPEAGTVKTNEFRMVPLHRHLIELGFVEFASSHAPDEYLFIKPTNPQDRSRVASACKQHGADLAAHMKTIVAKVVKANPEGLQPNHMWRHTFKTVCRERGIESEVCDKLVGHKPKTVGSKYGGHTPAELDAAMERFPRLVFAHQNH